MINELSKSAKFGFCFLLVGLLTMFVGCGEQGPEYFPVEGKVIFSEDSTPVQFGSIEFRSDSEPPVIARGKIQRDGSFRLSSSGRKGTIGGNHSVVIIQVIGVPRVPGMAKIVHDHGNDIAKKYSDYRTSGLKVEVQRETCRDIVLEVESK